MYRGIRRTLFAAVAFVMLAQGASAQSQTITGVGEGKMGEIKVAVELDGEQIKAVNVLEHNETPGLSDNAIAQIPLAIVEANSASVEAVSGATATSDGIMAAVRDALAQAGMATEEVKEAGPIAIPEHDEINKSDTLSGWRQSWIDRETESSIKYKAKVKTLENGVRVQSVPDDNRFWNVGVINAEERGCNACHKLEDTLENLPKKHNTFRTIGTMEMNVQSCMGCHRGYHEAWKSNAIVLDDAIHQVLALRDGGMIANGTAEEVIDEELLHQLYGIPFVHITMGTATMGDAYLKLGELLGEQERAQRLADYCVRTYAEICEIVGRVDQARILYITGEKGVNVIAKGSYQAEIIDLLADNLAVVDNPSARGTGNEVDMEQIIAWNPDIIFFSPESVYETADRDPLYQQLTAIQTGRYYEVPRGPFNWMGFPPSVQRLLGMQWMTKVLYPYAAEYDFFERAKEYFELFYHVELTREQYDGLVEHSLGK